MFGVYGDDLLRAALIHNTLKIVPRRMTGSMDLLVPYSEMVQPCFESLRIKFLLLIECF